MKIQYKADLALLGVTMAWGLSYIMSKSSLDILSTFNFLSIRFLIAAGASILLYLKRFKAIDKDTIKYGSITGFMMFLGYAIQTIGLNYTTASKSAFIIGFCVVLVPLFSSLFLKKIPKISSLVGVVLALIGLALLTLDGSLRLNVGDGLTFISTFCFAFYMLMISNYAPRVDIINFAIVQIGVVALLSTFITFLMEQPIIPTGTGIWFDILFLSLICTAGAFLIQNAAQKHTSATHTALIFSGEPVFAAICGYFMLGEVLKTQGMVGSILILMGILISEIDFKIGSLKTREVPQENTQ